MSYLDRLFTVWTPDRRGAAYPHAGTQAQRLAEGVIHELCHASTFGFDPFQFPGEALSEEIDRRFKRLRAWLSDRIELETLTVERHVMSRLRMPLDRDDIDVMGSQVFWRTKAFANGGAWKAELAKIYRHPQAYAHAWNVVGWFNRALASQTRRTKRMKPPIALGGRGLLFCDVQHDERSPYALSTFF